MSKNWNKVFKQLRAKPVKLKKYVKHNEPRERSCGRAKFRCERCGRFGGHIHKYRLGLCRCCFREVATSIGFKKYS